jgi:hypothetical protein
MTRYISFPQFPQFYSKDENGEEGYLEMPVKTVNQLEVRFLLVNGSKKNKSYLFIRSGDDLRIFANELFRRTGSQLVNGHTRIPIVLEENARRTIVFCLNHSPEKVESIDKLPIAIKPRKEFNPNDKLPLPKNLVFRFYSDPGHGWLAVKMNLLYALGIQTQISDGSYRSDDTAYLEEDGDVSTFAVAMEARGIPWEEITKKLKTTFMKSSSDRNYIRRKQFYCP